MGVISQEVGRGVLIFACVWFILFVNPKSPVRKIWWANTNLRIAIEGHPTFNIHKHTLRVEMDIMALSEVDIKQIYLELEGKRLPSDWDSNSRPHWDDVRGKAGQDCLELYFDIPDCVSSGSHTVRLIAVTKVGKSKSPKRKISILK